MNPGGREEGEAFRDTDIHTIKRHLTWIVGHEPYCGLELCGGEAAILDRDGGLFALILQIKLMLHADIDDGGGLE